MSSKVAYHEKFDADKQITLEERIASKVSELTDGTISDEVCHEIGKEALYVVISELRTDLLVGGLRHLVKKERKK